MKTRIKTLRIFVFVIIFCASISTAFAQNARIFIEVRVYNDDESGHGRACEAALSFIAAINLKKLESVEAPDTGYIDAEVLKKSLPPPLEGSYEYVETTEGPEIKRDMLVPYAHVVYTRGEGAPWDVVSVDIIDVGTSGSSQMRNMHLSDRYKKHTESTIIKGYDATVFRTPFTGDGHEVQITVAIPVTGTEGLVITRIDGPVTIYRKMKPMTPEVGEQMQVNDIIKTEGKGLIRFEVEDVNMYCLYENAQLQVIVKVKIETTSKFMLYCGEFWAHLRKLGCQVETPISVSGVRGTEFTLEVESDSTSTVTVIDGTLEFSDRDLKKTVMVPAGYRSIIKPGGLPSEPEKVSLESMPMWWIEEEEPDGE